MATQHYRLSIPSPTAEALGEETDLNGCGWHVVWGGPFKESIYKARETPKAQKMLFCQLRITHPTPRLNQTNLTVVSAMCFQRGHWRYEVVNRLPV